jgi:YVTN family beta-propeller protein
VSAFGGGAALPDELALGMTLGGLPSGVARANDFPTQARVEFVLGCMSEQGGQSYDTLYKCVCLVDAIAAEMSHDEFVQAQVFSQLRSTAGERGGVFRDQLVVLADTKRGHDSRDVLRHREPRARVRRRQDLSPAGRHEARRARCADGRGGLDDGSSNDVSVIDTASLNVIATIRVGASPWAVAVGPPPRDP